MPWQNKNLLIHPLINCYGDGKVGVLLSHQLVCKDKVVDFPKTFYACEGKVGDLPSHHWHRKRTFNESASHELLWLSIS